MEISTIIIALFIPTLSAIIIGVQLRTFKIIRGITKDVPSTTVVPGSAYQAIYHKEQIRKLLSDQIRLNTFRTCHKWLYSGETLISNGSFTVSDGGSLINLFFANLAQRGRGAIQQDTIVGFVWDVRRFIPTHLIDLTMVQFDSEETFELWFVDRVYDVIIEIGYFFEINVESYQFKEGTSIEKKKDLIVKSYIVDHIISSGITKDEDDTSNFSKQDLQRREGAK